MRRSILLAAAAALVTTGCLDYTIETTLEADGTGVRHERMEVTRNADFDLSRQDLLDLTRSGEARGWTASMEVQADGDTTWIQERRRDVRSVSGWSAGDGVILLGALPRHADRRLGYVRLGDVRLRSSVQVRSTPRSDGTTVWTYRESFVWDAAPEAIIEFLLRNVDGSLTELYPRVPAVERGGILGFARARIWDAGEEGLFFDENTDELVAGAVEGIADHAIRVVQAHYPEARRDRVAAVFSEAFALDDDETNRLFSEILPGLNLAFNTSVVFRLTMPGAVTTTNADSREGSALEWEFNPLDDLRGPIEIFAESVVRR